MGKQAEAVFINCSYGESFRPLLRAILFCTLRLGLKPLIANEVSDSGRVRRDRILKLIRQSQYSIHDLSTVVDTRDSSILHLNMPFELGLDLGVRFSDAKVQDRKIALVLEEKEGDVKKMMSDFGFGETKAHRNQGKRLVRAIRNHFYAALREKNRESVTLPDATDIWYEFNTFTKDLETTPDGRLRDPDDLDEMENAEFIDEAQRWIEDKVQQG